MTVGKDDTGAQLLLDLQGLQSGTFLGQIGIHQIADARLGRVLQLVQEGHLATDRLGLGAQGGQAGGHGLDRGV